MASASVLVDVGEQPLRRRLGRGLGKGHRLVHQVVHGLLHRLDLGLGEHPVLKAFVREDLDGIALLLPLHFLLRAIHGAGRIAHRVAPEAVGARLDQRRRLLPARALHGPTDAVADGQHVHAVHGLAGDAVGLGEAPDLGLGQRAVDGGAHGIAVVLAEIDYRQLPQRRQVQGLVELPLGHRAVAEVADDHLVAALVLDGEGRPGRQRQVRAHDGVAAEEVHALVEEMHRAALALAEPVAPAEELGHDPPRVGALRQALPMLAIRADRVVVRAERGGGPDRHGFLAYIKVEEAANLAERVHLGRLFLEAAQVQHLAHQPPGELGVEPARWHYGSRLRHKGTSATYQRIRFSSSTERRRRSRKIATMMASPTATSAAATHITKKTSACPSAVPWRWPKATRARLAAFSISSIDMKITRGLRRTSTPSTPMLNSTADRAT